MPNVNGFRDQYVIQAEFVDKISGAADAAAIKLTTLEQAALKQAASMVASGRAAEGAAAALQKLGSASGEGFQSTGPRIEAIEKGLFGVAAATAKADAALRDYNRQVAATKALNLGDEREAAILERLTLQYQKATAAAAALGEKLERGFTAPAGLSELERLRASIVPLFAVSKQYEQELNNIDYALKRKAISDAEAVAAQQRATAAFAAANQPLQSFANGLGTVENHAKRTGFVLRDLGIQSIDVFQQLATGAPVFTTFIQQGSQVGQVAASSGVGLGQLAAGAANLALKFAPLIGVLAVNAGIIAVGVSAEITERKLHTLENRLQGTHDNFRDIAIESKAASEQIAKALDVSTSTARQATDRIALSAAFQGTTKDLAELGRVALQLPDAFGKVEDKSKLVARALEEPSKVVKELAEEGLTKFNAQLQNTVGQLEDTGHRADAAAKVIEALDQQFSGSLENLTKIQQAWKELDNLWSSSNGEHFADSLGKAFQQAGADIILMIRNTIRELDDLKKFAANIDQGFGFSKIAKSIGDTLGPILKPGYVLNDIEKQAAARQQTVPTAAEALQQRIANAQIPTTIFDVPSGAGSFETNPQRFGFGAAAFDYNKAARERDSLIDKGDQGRKDKLRDSIEEMKKFREEAKAAFNDAEVKRWDEGIKAAEKSIAKIGKTTEKHRDEVDKLNDKLHSQTDQNYALAEAYLRGDGAVKVLTASYKAEQEVIATGLNPNKAKYREAVERLTQANIENAKSENAKQVAQATDKLNDQIELVKIETTTLGLNSNERERLISNLKVEQFLKEHGLTQEDKFGAAYARSTEQLRIANREFRLQEASLQELSSAFDTSFNQIGQAIADAFLSGEGHAVNFGNVVKGVIASIVQELVKLALINPLKNWLTGSALPDLFSVGSALFGGGSGGSASSGGSFTSALPLLATGYSALSAANFGGFGFSGSGGQNYNDFASSLRDTTANDYTAAAISSGGGSRGGGGSLLGTAGQVYQAFGLLDKLGFTNIGGQFSNFANNIGLTGEGGLFGGSGNIGGLFSGVNNFLNTPLVSGLEAGQFGPVTSGLASEGAGLPAGATIGTAIGGFGAGFGAGSLAGGLVQSAANKTGPGPQIGAAAGAAIGTAAAALAPFTFGGSLLVGGLIGGLVGGVGGGLIGPRPASPYAVGALTTNDQGLLVPGQFASQKMEGGYIAVQLQHDIDQINNILQQGGARITDQGGKYFIGSDPKHAAIQASGAVAASIGEAFPDFRFGSQDAATNSLIGGNRSFADIGELNTVLGTFKNFSAALTGAGKGDQIQRFVDSLAGIATSALPANLDKIGTFVAGTVPALLQFGKQTGTLETALASINATFDPAINTARELAYAESDLTDVRNKAIQKANDEAFLPFHNLGRDYNNRFAAAAAQVSGSADEALAAQLSAFDEAAIRERKALTDQLVQTYGEAGRTSQIHADLTIALDRALAEERLAIQKQSNQALVSAAASVVTSIRDYTRNLQFSAASPLSPQDQFAIAQKDFNAVSGAALAGNGESLAKLTQYADTFLGAARAVYGSGQGYADIFKNVVDTLGKVADLPTDTLTAAIFASETRTQTTILEDALKDLKAEVVALRAQMATSATMPDRLAAA